MRKIDITTHTLTRDGTFLIPCLKQVLPHVKQAYVALDSRSSKDTEQELIQLKLRYRNLHVKKYKINNPLIDLVAAKNDMIKRTKTKWFWILDDDDYYTSYIINRIRCSLFGSNKALAIKCWAVLNEQKYDRLSSVNYHEKIFKNTGNVSYQGTFGKEQICDELGHISYNRCYLINFFLQDRYIHLTHLKNSVWREEMNMRRKRVGENIGPLPIQVTNIIKKLYENMPNLRRYEV